MLHSTLYHIAVSTDGRRCLGNQFHLGDCRNTGKCLATKSQRCYVLQIFHLLNLAGGMTEKGQRDLLFFHTGSIVCNADQFFAAVRDLYGNSRRSGIDRIFYQFLHNRRGTLYHFTGCDLVNCILVQNCYFSQGCLLIPWYALLPAVFDLVL